MKWILSRKTFLNEAKLRDVILPRQQKAVQDKWGVEFLDMEEIEATPKIIQGKWTLTEEDKREALGEFLMADIDEVYKIFENLPEKFVEIFNKSIDLAMLDENGKKLFNNFNIKRPSVNQIGALTGNYFRKISVGETMAEEMIVRDESGRPVMGEDNRPTKVGKAAGEVIFSKNISNINTFVEDFNRCYPDSIVDANIFKSGQILRLVNNSREDFGGDDYNVDIDIYGRDLHLFISHKAKDILNISISRFYSSCQHLYSGGQRNKLIGNVFDPNTCPAFLIFDAPIYNNSGELINDVLPLSRMFIRNVESWESGDSKLYFDRAYPDRMESVIAGIIEKYSGNKMTYDVDQDGPYLFTPDLPQELTSKIVDPYMDRLNVNRYTLIGKNTKKLDLGNFIDWTKTKISPDAKIEDLTISTTRLPENFFKVPLNPEWVRFKFINIFSLSNFEKLRSQKYAFDKCKVRNNVISELVQNNPDLKSIQFVACDLKDVDLSTLKGVKELHLIYTIEDSKSIEALKDLGLTKLVVSGDLMSDSETKKIIQDLRRSGTKVEIKGPQI
jgi:hypothetical protein